jgi:hypothetical protein
VDLVFYNRLLRCFVLIDLKLGKLAHQDLGQMMMYVNWFDRYQRAEHEAPTVGIVLCSEKNDAVVANDRGSMLNRRDVLQKCVAAAFQEHESQYSKPTPPNTLGPFFKRLTPVNDGLRAPGDARVPLTISGQIFDRRGDAVTDASIEIWQTNHQGYYDLDGYRYRGKRLVDKSGAYSFESVIPGHYPDKSRICQHVHYLAIAPGHKTNDEK